jgi:hypothetical protein
VLFILTLLTWISSGAVTTLTQGLGGDQKVFKSPIVHRPGLFCAQDRASWYRRTFTKTVIFCLSYLALGLFTIALLRSSRIHSEESDFCPGVTQHIQQLHQTFKDSGSHILAALLIAPPSSDQTTLRNKIVDYLVPGFKIGEIVKMDQQKNRSPGVYQPIRDRMAHDEAMTFRDAEASERADSLQIGEEDTQTNRAASLAKPSVSWAPDPEHERPRRFNQYMQSRRRDEADGTAAYGYNLNPVSPSSNNTTSTQMSPRDLGFGHFNHHESNISPPAGPIRSVIRKTRSSIFGNRSSLEDEDVPTMPRQSLVYRATSNLFRSTVSSREHASVAAARSVSSPETQGPTGVVRIRDLVMEERARAMSFELDPGRFGFEEKFVGCSALPTESPEESSSTAETVACSAISDDQNDYTDNEGTVFGEDDTEVISENQELLHTPPYAAKVPVPVTQGGQDDREDSQPDSVAWLTDGFSPSSLNLLKDFGTPPRTEIHSPHSYPGFNMADEAASGMDNFDAPPLIGGFGTYEAEQSDITDTSKHRADIRTLARKLITMREAKNSEIQNSKARELAALARAEALGKILNFYGIPFEEVEKIFENEDAFDLTAGTQQTPTKTEFSTNPKGSFGGESGAKSSSHKKSKSQEGGFFKSLIGTTEPSLMAFDQYRERSLMEANVDENDPNLAAKLGVSSRQLPPEAPKPASKEPVPKAKSGVSNLLRRLSSMDNLKRKDTKRSDSSKSKNYSARGASENSHSSQSKDASLTSITEESARGSKSPEEASGPLSRKGQHGSFSGTSSLPASCQQHSRSSGALTGEHGTDLNLALTSLTLDRSRQQRRDAIPQGWAYMSVSKNGNQEEGDESNSKEGEDERSIQEEHAAEASINSSSRALVYKGQANFNEDHGDQIPRSSPPSRSPPPRPSRLTYQYFEKKEV